MPRELCYRNPRPPPGWLRGRLARKAGTVVVSVAEEYLGIGRVRDPGNHMTDGRVRGEDGDPGS